MPQKGTLSLLAAAGLVLAACGAPAAFSLGSARGGSRIVQPSVAPESRISGAGPVAEHSVTRSTAPAALQADLDQLEEALFTRVNADRAAYGLPPVVFDSQLREIARARAAAQLGQPALSHDDATGPLTFRRLMRDAGVAYRLAGENLARPRAVSGSAEEAVAAAQRALMLSEIHRDNILAPAFDRLAVGAAIDPRGELVFAQVFRAA